MCILVFLFMCGRICPEKYSCRTDFPDKALFTKPDGKWNYGQLADSQIACAERARKYLAMALESLDMGETLDAVTVMIDNGANALLELTGEKATEAVVDEVFSKFCVGK